MDPIVLGAVVAAAWLVTRKPGPNNSAADHGGGGASVGGAEQGAEPEYDAAGTSTTSAVASVAPGEIVGANNPITGAPTSVGHDGAGPVVHEETGSSGKTPTTSGHDSPFKDEVGDIVDRGVVSNTSFVTVGDSDAVLASNVRAGGRYGIGDAFAAAPHIRTDVVKATKAKSSCACVKPPCACAPSTSKPYVPPETPDKYPVQGAGTAITTPGTGIMPPQKTTAKDQAKVLSTLGPRVGAVW